MLEVFGDPGATAMISYTDVDARPQHLVSAALPWSYRQSTTTPAVIVNIMAQSDGNSVGCRIVIDGVDATRGGHSRRVHLLPGQVRMTIATFIRRLCVPIFLAWLALAAITNVSVPRLEKVAEAHNVALSAQDAPSMIAMKHIGKVFKEFDSDSAAMIVLEGEQPLGADAHAYYDVLIPASSNGTPATFSTSRTSGATR